jgi:tetratricopeptide (TPR) repeat protein
VRRLRAEWRRQPGIEVADALGWALHRAGRDQEALRFAMIATDRARGGAVRSAPYVYHRGMIERGLGRYGPARRHLEEALRINPRFSPLHAPVARAALAEMGAPALTAPPEVRPSADRPDARPSTDPPEARPSANPPDTRLSTDRPDARPSTDRPDTRPSAGRPEA